MFVPVSTETKRGKWRETTATKNTHTHTRALIDTHDNVLFLVRSFVWYHYCCAFDRHRINAVDVHRAAQRERLHGTNATHQVQGERGVPLTATNTRSTNTRTTTPPIHPTRCGDFMHSRTDWRCCASGGSMCLHFDLCPNRFIVAIIRREKRGAGDKANVSFLFVAVVSMPAMLHPEHHNASWHLSGDPCSLPAKSLHRKTIAPNNPRQTPYSSHAQQAIPFRSFTHSFFHFGSQI